MFNEQVEALIQMLSTVALAIIAVVIGYKKLVKGIAGDNAETSVITVMHAELERMNKQNTALSNEIGRLHKQMIELNKQLQDLNIENRRLQSEVVALTAQVTQFTNSVAIRGKQDATS